MGSLARLASQTSRYSMSRVYSYIDVDGLESPPPQDWTDALLDLLSLWLEIKHTVVSLGNSSSFSVWNLNQSL